MTKIKFNIAGHLLTPDDCKAISKAFSERDNSRESAKKLKAKNAKIAAKLEDLCKTKIFKIDNRTVAVCENGKFILVRYLDANHVEIKEIEADA